MNRQHNLASHLYKKGLLPDVNTTAFRIALVYLVFGSLWISFSDTLILGLISSPLIPSEESLSRLSDYQTAKGWLFIFITAALLTQLIRGSLKKQNAYLQKISDIESKLRLAIESSGIGLWQWDPNKDLIHYSAEWKKQLGYSDDEFKNDTEEMRKRLHPDDLAHFDRRADEFFRDPTRPYHNEFRLRHKDGTWRTIYSRGTMQFDANGEPALLLGTHADITHVKEREQALQVSQQRIQHLLEASPSVLYVLEITDTGKSFPTYVSSNIERIFGFSREEALKPDWWQQHIFDQDKTMAQEAYRKLLADGSTGSKDSHYRFLDKSGKIHWIRDFSRVVDGRVNGAGKLEVIGLFTDMTHEHESRETLKILSTAFTNMVDGVLITDADGVIDSCNPAFEQVFAYQEEELLHQHLDILDANEHTDRFFKSLLDDVKAKDNWAGYSWGISSTGIRIPFWLTANVIRNPAGHADKIVFIFRDMSAINEKEAELTRLAHFDRLTNLPNREYFNTQMTHAIRKAERKKSKLALLFIDLDDFKDVNDSLGFDYGNELLVRFSDHLKSLMRGTDILARVGGDEFILLMEADKAYKESMAFAQSILNSLNTPFQVGSMHTVYITPSIGISLFPQNGQTPEKLIQRGNVALNHSKAAGKNTLCFFSEEMEERVNEQLQLINAMRDAINNRDFEVHYQPKLLIGTQSYAGAEALVRWRTGDGEMIAPGKFIPLAESTGLISRIGDQVLTMVARQIRAWLDAGKDPGVISINISVKQFLDPDLVAKIRKAIDQYRIPAGNLAIEITESALMTDPDRVKDIIHSLQNLGLEVHLDDFGTGFSSFSYLSSFVLHTLKIDMSFVRHINRSEKDNQIILSMLHLAQNLGMNTVAEGVELEDHVHFLERHGCNVIQGYFYSPPLPTDKFDDFLDTARPGS